MKALIYIDEFGTADTEVPKKGNSSHFIYAGLVISEQLLKQAENIRSEISKEYFNGGVIKSKKIRDSNLRQNILRKTKETNCLIFALVVDKAEIDGEGLQIKATFYKFFHRLFIERLESHYDQFDIVSDKSGGTNFQRELIAYLDQHVVKRDLFNQERYFKLADDKVGEPLIQLADFVAGSLGRIFSTSHITTDSDKLLEILSDKLIIDFFPYQRIDLNSSTKPEIDNQVAEIAVSSARRYLVNNSLVEKREVVKYLLMIFSVAPDRLVSTQELCARVQLFLDSGNYSKEQLRQHVGELRDEGVLIASIQGKWGYKLPNRVDDVALFFKLYLDSVIPMLKRIKIADDTLKIHSHSSLSLKNEMSQFTIIEKLIRAAGI